MNDSFVTRPGTTNDGKNFENYFIAILILELTSNDTIINFKLSANDNNFGKIDDVVLEINDSNGRQNYAFQLKHKNNKKCIDDKDLTADKGNFAIKAYFKSVSSEVHSNNSNFNWILFTNYKFDAAKTNMKIKECKTHKILRSIYFKNCVQFIPEPDQENEYQSFLSSFFLYANGPSVEHLKKQGSKIFRTSFQGTKKMFEEYVNFITTWNNRGGIKHTLDKDLIKQVITNLLVFPFVKPIPHAPHEICSEKLELLRKAISSFDITLFTSDNFDRITHFWSYLWNDFQENSDSKELLKKYQIASDGWTNITNEEFTMVMWLLGYCPLVVKDNTSVRKAIELCTYKNFVLITKEYDFEYCHGSKNIFRNVFDLRIKPDEYKNILNVFTCSIQGKQEISLKQLIQENNQIEETVTTNHLLQMIGSPLQIGENKEVENTYIERFLSRNIISPDFLPKMPEDTFVVISRVLLTQYLETYLRNANVVIDTLNGTVQRQTCNTNKTVYLMKTECSNDTFMNLCNRNKGYLTYHQFRITNCMKLEWVRSKGDITDLKEFQQEEGYIQESQLHDSSMLINTNLNIICGPPGIGKTVFAKNLKNNFSSEQWSILLNPKDYSKDFRENLIETHNLFDHILDKIGARYRGTDLKLFKLFRDCDRIFLIWDGIDELSERNLDRLLHLIVQLSGRGIRQCVTSRSTLKSLLETRLNVFGREMQPFDQDNLKMYITKQINCSNETVKNILLNINSCFFKYSEVLRIPLHLYVFTEILRCNKEKYSALLKNILSLTDLYECFVQQQFNIYFKKKGCRNDNDIEHTENKKFMNDRLDLYQKTAIKLYLSLPLDNAGFLIEITSKGDIVGIITEVEENTPIFLHNSYAEYFAALYLSKHYKEIEDFDKFIFQRRHKNIRFLFDLLLAKNNECLAHIAVLNKNFEVLVQLDKSFFQKKDQGGRNPLHVACSYGEQYPSLYVREIRNFKMKKHIVYDKTGATKSEDPEYKNILQFLSENCNLDDKDEVFGFDPCLYADISQCVYPLIVLLSHRKINFSLLTNFKSSVTIIYYSIMTDFSTVLDKNIPYIKSQRMDGSILFLAAKFDSIKCLDMMSSSKTYKQKLNKQKNLERFVKIACKYGSFKVIKFLVDYIGYSVVNLVRSSRNLQLAIENGSYNLVKLLVDHEVDVNVWCENMTPLHKACINGDLEIVKLLINNGAKIDTTDSIKRSLPLHYACIYGHLDVVKFLCENGARIDIKDEDNISPLDSAFRNEKLEIVKYFSEFLQRKS